MKPSQLIFKVTFTILTTLFFAGAQSQAIIALPVFATGFTNPVEIAHTNDSRLFVAEKGGAIKIINTDGSVNPQNFLTLDPDLIQTNGDRGLLGLAFHPQYASNGSFYVFYTRVDGASILAHYSVDPDNPNAALPSSQLVLMEIPQPSDLHKGGALHFGPDGYLYIMVGDGGASIAAQNTLNPYGKILRIDVDHSIGELLYAIPEGNPFYASGLGIPEAWSWGLRNAWKFSFDRLTGDSWIADVGLDTYEEINHAAALVSGSNYGWPCYEGNSVLIAGCAVPEVVYTAPVASFAHADGNCAITGGYVYRGVNFPNLAGKYLFTDFCTGKIGMLDVADASLAFSEAFPNNYFTTFGEDVNGEMYIASSTTGILNKITDVSLAASTFEKRSFTIFPNPANTQFSIATLPANYPVNLVVADLTGKILYQKQLSSENEQIETTMLQSGIYIVNATNARGNVSSMKLTITR